MLKDALLKMPEAFAAKILLRGEEYFQTGHVLNIRLSEGLLRGRVKGSSNQIYDVYMDLKTWPGRAAQCTCTFARNCKHAAACLLALRDREFKSSDQQSATKLDRKLDTWLKNLRAQEQATSSKNLDTTHHLMYLLDLKLRGNEHKVSIKLALAKRLKKGGYGKKVVFSSLSNSKKQFFIDNDNDIIAQLFYKCDVSGWCDNLSLRNSELLEKILKTNRAYFIDNDNLPIKCSEQIKGTCQWVLRSNGEQHLVLMHNDQAIEPLLLDASWYFDYAQTTMGRLETPYPMKQLRHMLEAPPVPMDQTELVVKKMAQTCPEFPVPEVYEKRKIKEATPTPILIFNVLEQKETKNAWLHKPEHENKPLFVVRVNFDYDGIVIPSNESADRVVHKQDETLIECKRDFELEVQKQVELNQELPLRALLAHEMHHWQLKKNAVLVLKEIKDTEDMDVLYATHIPNLQNQGWRIEFASNLYQEVLTADDVEWFSDLQKDSTEFFSYQLGILVEGRPVSIVPLVADLIHRYKGSDLENVADAQLVKLPLSDDKVLQVSMGRIKPLVRMLLQIGLRHINTQQQLQINKYQLLLMQEAELAIAATKARWQGAENLRSELLQLTKLKQLPDVQVPKGLNAQLRDYQHEGLNWLQFLRTSKFGGVLADDMGLGKTIQTLAHLLYEKEQGRLCRPTLIIAPTSLVGNWYAESKRFTPKLSVLVYHGSERHQDNFEKYDVIISTYGLIHRDKEKFVSHDFYYLIIDEAQFIKNARTKTTQVIQQLQATHRLCLTGTPLENHLGELWSLFHFLMPGLLGDPKQFRSWFRTPIEKNADEDRRKLLTNRVKPFLLRRTKNQVARELPLKTEMIRTVEIAGPQRDLYEAIRMSMEQKVRDAIAKQGLGKSHIVLLDALLKLRQACCDPRLLSLPEAKMAHGSSAKLEALMDLLDNLVEEGRRVLVFSQFTSMLELIEQELIAKQYDYLKLTGQTQNRQSLVDTFQQGNFPIFLISLKAGGTGLNLTRADTVIHYDPWWNPAVEDQATDRTHRIGQENPVFVYKLITSGTVEEAILSMQDRKRQLVDGILAEDAAKTTTLTESDIEQFFIPL